MSDKAYSEVIELNFSEIVTNSLTPSTIITHSANMAIKYFNRYYWPLFDRMDKKGVAFEPHKWSISIFNTKTNFPKDRNLLFVTKALSVKNRNSLLFFTEIFDPINPFKIVAQCGIETKEAKIESDWLGEYEDADKPICSDVAELTDETKDNAKVINIHEILKSIDNQGEWIGAVETQHFCLPEYCEFVGLGAMSKIAGVITANGKLSLLKWARENNIDFPLLEKLRAKTNYLNWNFWADRINTFWQYDEIVVKSYCMVVKNKIYLKHLTYMKAPKILTNTFIEEYSLV